jgi:hypothetical protein
VSAHRQHELCRATLPSAHLHLTRRRTSPPSSPTSSGRTVTSSQTGLRLVTKWPRACFVLADRLPGSPRYRYTLASGPGREHGWRCAGTAEPSPRWFLAAQPDLDGFQSSNLNKPTGARCAAAARVRRLVPGILRLPLAMVGSQPSCRISSPAAQEQAVRRSFPVRRQL